MMFPACGLTWETVWSLPVKWWAIYVLRVDDAIAAEQEAIASSARR